MPGDALDGGLQGGIAYLFPKDHARVQVSFGGEKVWKGDDPELEFTCRKVPTGMALREFMEQMGAKGDDWVVCYSFFLCFDVEWDGRLTEL